MVVFGFDDNNHGVTSISHVANAAIVYGSHSSSSKTCCTPPMID